MLDKAVLCRSLSFINKYDIFHESQVGFIPGKNTSHSILSLVDYIHNSLESKQITCDFFLDISKAFDTIDHNTLMGKRDKCGIREIALAWFKHYLSERCQFESLDNCHSTLFLSDYGVPQGSILGPILFLLPYFLVYNAHPCIMRIFKIETQFCNLYISRL